MFYDRNGNVIEVGYVTEDNIPIHVWSLPKVFITCDTPYTSMSDTKVNGVFSLIDGKAKLKEVPITIKIQGNASVLYQKKNLNITFFEDDTRDKKKKIIFGGWYPTNKIHLKANEYDFSMCRNSVGTKIAYDLMGKSLPNGARGYIDSFPVIMFYNDIFQGCFTINLPQEGNTFNFDEENPNHLAYRCGGTGGGWDTDITRWEYRGDADETEEMTSKFQTVLSVMANSANLTKEIVEAHFDVDTLVSYLVFGQIAYCPDSFINNWTIATWDGVKWYHIFYDLDMCFGLGFSGSFWALPTGSVFEQEQSVNNAFFTKVRELYADEMSAKYAEMRKYGADVETITKRFYDFQNTWGSQNILADRTMWADDKQNSIDIKDSGTTTYNMKTWLTERFAYLDELYGYTE